MLKAMLNELGKIVENALSVPPFIPLPGATQQDFSIQNAQTPATANAVTRGRERAEVELGGHSLDRPVRVIHMICLLHH